MTLYDIDIWIKDLWLDDLCWIPKNRNLFDTAHEQALYNEAGVNMLFKDIEDFFGHDRDDITIKEIIGVVQFYIKRMKIAKNANGPGREMFEYYQYIAEEFLEFLRAVANPK